MDRKMMTYIEYVSNLYKPIAGYEDGFDKEFQEAKLYGSELKINPDCKTLAGQSIENKKKNRYKDILPFDKCRVKLDQSQNGTDYINASFIKGSNGGERYIASQGPLPHTVNDFWEMLWQYDVKVIVMVCKEIELGKKKCERYWAIDQSEELHFGDIIVHLHEEQPFDDGYCLRTIKATRGHETKYLQQFHYNSWPDHGVPKTCFEILTLINHIREVQAHSEDKSSPLCVHCSAGCGRTGTVLVVDYIRNILLNKDLSDKLHTLDIVKEMRCQRPSIVQTKEQYQFVCNTVSEMFKLFMKNRTVKFTKDDILLDLYVNVAETAPPPKPSRQRQQNVVSKPAASSRPVSMITMPSSIENNRVRKFSTPFIKTSHPHGDIPILATPPPKPPMNRRPVPQQKSNKPPQQPIAARPNDLPTVNSVPSRNLSSPQNIKISTASTNQPTPHKPPEEHKYVNVEINKEDPITGKKEKPAEEKVAKTPPKLVPKPRKLPVKSTNDMKVYQNLTNNNNNLVIGVVSQKSPKTEHIKGPLKANHDIGNTTPTTQKKAKMPPATKPKPRVNMEKYLSRLTPGSNLQNSSKSSASVFDLRTVAGNKANENKLKEFNRAVSIDGSLHSDNNISPYQNSPLRTNSLKTRTRANKHKRPTGLDPLPMSSPTRTIPSPSLGSVSSIASIFEKPNTKNNPNNNNNNSNKATPRSHRVSSSSSVASSVFVTSPIEEKREVFNGVSNPSYGNPTKKPGLLPKPRKSPVKPPRSSKNINTKADEAMFSGVQKTPSPSSEKHYANENSLGLKFDGRHRRKYESVKLSPSSYVNDRTRSHSTGTTSANGTPSPVPTLPARTPESYVTISDDDHQQQTTSSSSYETIQFQSNTPSPPRHNSETSTTSPQPTTNNSTSAPSVNVSGRGGHLQKARGIIDKSLSEVTSAFSKVGASLGKSTEDDAGPNQPTSVRDRIKTFSAEPYIYHGQDISFGNRLNQKVHGSRPLPL